MTPRELAVHYFAGKNLDAEIKKLFESPEWQEFERKVRNAVQESVGS